MKRTGLNIICSLLLAGGMCACTATPKQTEEIKWSERMAQSEMQRFPEPWMIEKGEKASLGLYARTGGEIHVGGMETYR